MLAREGTTIEIRRVVSSSRTSRVMKVAEVLITQSSVRRYRLMEDNSVTLRFSHANAFCVRVGDFVQDEVFGKFYAIEEQIGRYNQSTGAYDYELKFCGVEYTWKNRKCMYTTTEQVTGKRYRKELSWHLTADLQTHAQKIKENIDAVASTEGWSVAISTEIDMALEHHLIDYNGVSIFEALNLLCDSYECEWWVDTDHYLYIGKCENWKDAELEDTSVQGIYNWTPTDAGALVFDETKNVEKMTFQKDQTESANALYVYGGTKNIPSNYNRRLIGEVEQELDDTESMPYMTFLPKKMGSEYPTSKWFKGDKDFTNEMSFTRTGNSSIKGVYSFRSVAETGSGTIRVHGSGTLYTTFSTSNPDAINTGTLQYKISVTIYKDGNVLKTLINDETKSVSVYRPTGDKVFNMGVGFSIDVNSGDIPIVNGSLYSAEISIRSLNWSNGSVTMPTYICDKDFYNGDVYTQFTSTHAYYQRNTYINFNGEDYKVRIYPDYPVQYSSNPQYYARFVFLDSNGNMTDPPEDFGEGSKYYMYLTSELPEELPDAVQPTKAEREFLAPYNTSTPLSAYSDVYSSEGSLMSIGERRLNLPVGSYPQGCIRMLRRLTQESVTEKIVVFDNIYPQCVLKITDVALTTKKEKTTYEDGSTAIDKFYEYKVKLAHIGGEEFPFTSDMILDGKALEVTFLSMSSLTDTQKQLINTGNARLSSLCGMTFECNFSNGQFLLIINTNYGTELPNETLKPQIGDVLTLLNWDVRNMESLGLVALAEEKLAEKGNEYFNAMHDNNFTFTCQMMSTDMIKKALYDKNGLRMVKDSYIYVKGDGQEYTLPDVGEKVTIVSNVLSGGQKTSRILGYELKLDIPYDSPTYTIGETDAYSRLKKLEKEITKL